MFNSGHLGCLAKTFPQPRQPFLGGSGLASRNPLHRAPAGAAAAGFRVGTAMPSVLPFSFMQIMQMKNLRHCYLLVVLLFAAGLGSARAQSFAWAKLARVDVDTVFGTTRTSATSARGDTYAYIQYSDSLMLGRTRITGQRYNSAALIKYDSTGAVLWAKNLNGIRIARLAADNVAGGVFLVASQQSSSSGSASWDGTPLPAALSSSFYAKCTTTGALQWTQAVPTTLYDASIAADNSGNAYVLATALSAATIGGTAVDAYGIFILKTNGFGITQWVQALHGPVGVGSISGIKLAAKPAGGFLIAGPIQNTLYLGAGTANPLLSPTSQSRTFISSFDNAGAHQWSNLFGTYTTQAAVTINAVAADANGNSYITGNTSSSLQAGNAALPGGFFLAQHDASGALQWARGQQTSNAGNYSDAGLLLAATNRGVTVAVQATYPSTAPMTLGTLPLPSFYNFVYYTAQGGAQWAVGDNPRYLSGVTPVPPYFQPLSMGSNARGDVYALGTSYPRQNRFGNNPLPVIQFGAQTIVGRGTILTRLNSYANTLRGQVYLDQNANGLLDAGEPPFPRPLAMVLTQGNKVYSPVNSTGAFQAYASPGAYTLELAQVPVHYLLTQPARGSFSGTFSGSNQLMAGQDFGLVPQFNINDIRITLTPYNAPRPGFTTSYRVSIENTGTSTVSGAANLVLDSHFTYVSSTPSATRSGQTLTWNYTNLAPFGQLHYDILLSLPTNAVMGTLLTSTATAPLTGDVEPTDNTSTLAHNIVSSYDPNSMEVNYERITPTQVAAQQWLEYTIHFQNLGTASAINVILSDTLDYNKLNPATIQWITQSHNCSWSLTSIGPNTGLLTVRFLNINLPERNVDVIRSQGFVRFRVRARPTLAVGEIIPNHAGIVFDYNSPVITNTATTTVFLVTAALGRHDAPAWTAYPNPATDALTISADLATAGPVRVELLDMLGRPVRQQLFTAPAGPLHQALNLQSLAAGVYVLRLTPPTGPATSRQVVIN
jgi:hypothetical protein